MKEQLIKIETAELAKAKGFNIPLAENTKLYPETCRCTTPTQALLQKWLREVHKIECYAYPYRDHADDNNDPIKYRGHRNGMKMFNTFEEALESDLQEV